MTRDVSVQTIAHCSDQENGDGGEAHPFGPRTLLNALTVIDGHGDESRNHQNPNHSDFVGRRHDARVTKAIVGRFGETPILRLASDTGALQRANVKSGSLLPLLGRF